MRGWHCGDDANSTHVSFEICEDDLTDPEYFAAVYREAVELTAYLCEMYGLDPMEDGCLLYTSSWPEQQATFTSRISATAGAQGGTGGTGGKGADGCILVYYSVEEQIGQPKQLKDRTGKMALDRYGRRIIM